MDYRYLGRTGIKVSPLCLGSGNFADPTPEDEAILIIEKTLDAGINCIDTGDGYANGNAERIIGKALMKNGRRARVVLITKVGYPAGPGPNERGNSRRHIMRACERSLDRLHTDCIDLYMLLRPSFETSMDETLGALTDLVRQGKVRYIGCSTHPAWKVMEALMVSETKGHARFIAEESPYNLLDRRIENELIPMCQAYGVGILAWAPMAMGMLAGRYSDASNYPDDSQAGRRGGTYAGRVTAEGVQIGNGFVDLAKRRGIPPAQLAVLWVKDQPGITSAIVGPKTVEQLEYLLPVAEMSLDDSTRAACDSLVPPGSVVADFHNTSGWMKMRVSSSPARQRPTWLPDAR